MTTIYFVRHGEFKNPGNIIPWRLPGFPLTEKGKKDIMDDANYFKNIGIKVIYSSPIQRAKESAEIISRKLKIPFYCDSLIQEIYTPLQKKMILYEDLQKDKDIPYWKEYHINNQGESLKDVYERIDLFIKKILKINSDNILIVSHGDPIMIYSYWNLGIKDLTSYSIEDNFKYIPKAGILKLSYINKKLITINPINY